MEPGQSLITNMTQPSYEQNMIFFKGLKKDFVTVLYKSLDFISLYFPLKHAVGTKILFSKILCQIVLSLSY